MILSAIATLIVDTFLPDTYQKYLFLNYKHSAKYRSYKSSIPDFLQGRPQSVIIHSLERQSKSLKYTEEDVCTVDEEGTFTVKGSNGNDHTVSFGSESDNTTPSVHAEIGWNGTFPVNIFGLFLDSTLHRIGQGYLKAIKQVPTSALIQVH